MRFFTFLGMLALALGFAYFGICIRQSVKRASITASAAVDKINPTLQDIARAIEALAPPKVPAPPDPKKLLQKAEDLTKKAEKQGEGLAKKGAEELKKGPPHPKR